MPCRSQYSAMPAHTPATDNIAPLCRHNAKALLDNKAFVLARSDRKTFEEIFAAVTHDFGIELDMDKYAKLTFTVRIYLQALIEDGVLTASLESGKLVYHRI